MSSKSAIVCNTPLQVLGAINIVANNVEGTRNCTDLYISGNFRHVDEICAALEETRLFNRITRCAPKEKQTQSHKLQTLRKLCSPRAIWAERQVSDPSVLTADYDQIFVGDNDLIGAALNAQSRNADIIVYDDGMDCYVGNCITGRLSAPYRMIGRLLHIGVFAYRIKKLLINNTAFCRSEISPCIQQLPRLTADNPVIPVAKTVFSFQDSLVPDRRFILLGQPLEELPGYNGKPFLSAVPPAQDASQFLLRAHPRQELPDTAIIDRDTVGNLWELECIFSLRDEQVLLGCYSTSQLAPKMIAGKEPYVVFLYKLFLPGLPAAEEEKYKTMISLLQESYQNKNKIFIPETFEELYELLQEI